MAAIGTLCCALLVLPLVASKAWTNVAVFICIYVTVVVGLTLLYGYANQLSFGHAGLFGVGAYVSVLASPFIGVWLAMAMAPVVTGLVGYAIGRPIVRLQGLSLGLATMAFGEIMHVLFVESSLTGGAIGLSAIPSPSIGGFVFDTAQRYYYLVLTVAVVATAISYNIGVSYVGRALKALATNESAGKVVGVDVVALKAAAFGYSAALAGLGGALYAHYVTFISADSFRADFSILLVIMVAVGGKSFFLGAILGASILTVIPQLLRGIQEYAVFIYGLTLIVIFMYMPNGILGVISSALRRRA
jgi:branched-chain amino acid transport system permease protein